MAVGKANLSCCQDIDGDLVYDPAGFPENDIDDPLTDFVEVKKDNPVLFNQRTLIFQQMLMVIRMDFCR